MYHGAVMIVISSYFAEHRLFYRALLQKRPVILRSLLIGILLIVMIDYHGAVVIVMIEYQNRIPWQSKRTWGCDDSDLLLLCQGILLIVINYHGAVMIVMIEYQNRIIEYQNRDDRIPK